MNKNPDMKNIYRYILLVLFPAVLFSCAKEELIVSDFEAPGPVPAIADGPLEAQQICHALWKKYDLHVYYTLSGDDALNTPMGRAQTSMIEYNNPLALPMQPANEEFAVQYLKMIQSILSFMPEEVVKKQLFKRHVLVAENCADMWMYYDEYFMPFYDNTYYEEGLGILYHGDFTEYSFPDYTGWKYSFLSDLFYGMSEKYVKNIPIPDAYGLVSKDYYQFSGDGSAYFLYFGDYGEYLKEGGFAYGFTHPKATEDTPDHSRYDFAHMAAWIVTAPEWEKEMALDSYPMLKLKHDICVGFFKSRYNLDLVAMNPLVAELDYEW